MNNINSRETKPAGYFSRRHQSGAAHEMAVIRYHTLHGSDARKVMADENKALRAELSPREQVHALDSRLGYDVGAKRERARLARQIAAQA